ncbi:unknown [Singapore grouper iridovirus]|uniref:Uncharacterized protein n=1 Tax=Singapore grouper iridovirus TaxID=262968 RepID=Q5YFD8_9VIRU|nr:hypothetical protein ORF127R [Singapore grouper iridovirus]AAS18142.1 unknown [Singapore grouper iridovirus]WAU86836.1 hypothetical protein ORF127R [Singapore grouper iridovirus]
MLTAIVTVFLVGLYAYCTDGATPYYFNIQCTSCALEEGASEAVQTQQKGYLSERGEGTTLTYNQQQYANGTLYGFTLIHGELCSAENQCQPNGYYHNHWCIPVGKTEWVKCAKFNKDQYGRECEDVKKDRQHGTWCYVKNRNTYWPHNGGKWGYTHPAACEHSRKLCRYSFNE